MVGWSQFALDDGRGNLAPTIMDSFTQFVHGCWVSLALYPTYGLCLKKMAKICEKEAHDDPMVRLKPLSEVFLTSTVT